MHGQDGKMEVLVVFILTALCSFGQKQAYTSPFEETSFTDFINKVLGLENQYCGGLCDSKFDLQDTTGNSNCDHCMCDDLCPVYGDCCLDAVLSSMTLNSSDSFGTRCVMSTVKPDYTFYRMLTSCADDWLNDEVRSNCTTKCSRASPECFIPVTNINTGITYRNRFCAECNRENETVVWDTLAKCTNKTDIFSRAKSAKELFNYVLETEKCNIVFEKPDILKTARTCQRSDDYIISSCNVTGQWEVYDENIEKACSLYTRVVKGKYKNMFCCLCNGPVILWSLMKTETDYTPVKSPSSIRLTALLQFSNTPVESQNVPVNNLEIVENGSHCFQTQITDSECKCRTLQCAEDKYLTDGTCRSYVPIANTQGYKLCFHVLIRFNSLLDTSLKNLQYVMSGMNTEIAHRMPPFVYVVHAFSKFIYVNTNNLVAKAQLSVSVILSSIHNKDTLQISLLDGVNGIKELKLFPRTNVSFQDICGNDTIPTKWKIGQRLIEFETIESTINPPMTLEILELSNQVEYVALNRYLICPYIILKKGQFYMSNSTDRLNDFITERCTDLGQTETETDAVYCENYTVVQEDISISLPSGEVLPSDKYLFVHENVKVCKDDFQVLISNKSKQCQTGNTKIKPYGDVVNMPTSSTLGVLSLVCTCVSLFFLLLTFITYCLLPQLRTTGGVCNMGLIVTLFIAQALYEFGMEQYEDVLSCKIIGILIHFFWLAAVLWTNACVIQFFYRLCFPIRSRTMSPSTRRVFLVFFVYSYGITLCVVSVNVMVNSFGFGDVGYGGNMCYFNTVYGQILAFLVPVGLITVANVVLFLITVIRLRCYKGPSSNIEHKISLLACVKLSTLSGLSWLFAFLYNATGSDVFSYVFTVLVGAQGLFLCLVLVVNKHTYNLFIMKYKRRSH